jgi:hypothetical protein
MHVCMHVCIYVCIYLSYIYLQIMYSSISIYVYLYPFLCVYLCQIIALLMAFCVFKLFFESHNLCVVKSASFSGHQAWVQFLQDLSRHQTDFYSLLSPLGFSE